MLTQVPQFGFDGSDIWITRRDTLFASLHANPKAKFITRGVQFGSEPLYDNVLPHQELAEQVILAKANLSSLNIPVTVSELAYGYQERGGAQDVLDAIDFINIHMLPFFDQDASTGTFRLLLLRSSESWCSGSWYHLFSKRLMAHCDRQEFRLVHTAWKREEDVLG